MDDEPSYFAQEIMADIVAGRRRKLSEREVSKLSEYECLAIDRASRKNGYTLSHQEDRGEFDFQPPPL
jgi:hypothetical protein